VYPRREVLDPQGMAIRNALGRLGFEEVEDVRAGKSFEIDLEAEDAAGADRRLQDMCEKLLANTVVEDYTIEVLASSSNGKFSNGKFSKRKSTKGKSTKGKSSEGEG
jgi:phosphoribosylformylglycinamidine synthase PurS subunit